MSKKVHEKNKVKESKQYRAVSWLKVLSKWAMYLVFAAVVLSIAGPMIAMNYISNQIKSGEWGADFQPKPKVQEADSVNPTVNKADTGDEVKWRNYFDDVEEESNLESWFNLLDDE